MSLGTGWSLSTARTRFAPALALSSQKRRCAVSVRPFCDLSRNFRAEMLRGLAVVAWLSCVFLHSRSMFQPLGPLCLCRTLCTPLLTHVHAPRCCPTQLIVPGFVDCHIHYPQIDIVGSYGEQLLEWLQNYVFPAEAKFKDGDYADKVAKVFVNELLKSGTTTALTFCTVHPQSVDALFTAAQERNMLMIAGKVLMDDEKFAPDSLREDCHQSYEESKALIAKWHGNGRCLYAVTPRFAVSSTPEELALAGQLYAEHEGVYMQTHLNENMAEIALAKQIHNCETYLGIYDKHGLTGICTHTHKHT